MVMYTSINAVDEHVAFLRQLADQDATVQCLHTTILLCSVTTCSVTTAFS